MANLVAGHFWVRGTTCPTPMPLAQKHRLNVAGLVLDDGCPNSNLYRTAARREVHQIFINLWSCGSPLVNAPCRSPQVLIRE